MAGHAYAFQAPLSVEVALDKFPSQMKSAYNRLGRTTAELDKLLAAAKTALVSLMEFYGEPPATTTNETEFWEGMQAFVAAYAPHQIQAHKAVAEELSFAAEQPKPKGGKYRVPPRTGKSL